VNAEKVQVKEQMDVKTSTGLTVSIDAVKKPAGANKL
jgi:hypothetical protein